MKDMKIRITVITVFLRMLLFNIVWNTYIYETKLSLLQLLSFCIPHCLKALS